MGSKYEYTLFPVISAGMGAVFLLLAKQARIKKWTSFALIEKIFLVTAIGEILLFHGIGGAVMWTAMHSKSPSSTPAADFAPLRPRKTLA